MFNLHGLTNVENPEIRKHKKLQNIYNNVLPVFCIFIFKQLPDTDTYHPETDTGWYGSGIGIQVLVEHKVLFKYEISKASGLPSP